MKNLIIKMLRSSKHLFDQESGSFFMPWKTFLNPAKATTKQKQYI